MSGASYFEGIVSAWPFVASIFSIVPRYRHPKAADAYGRVVHRHLRLIKSKLLENPPDRQSWNRFCKDVMDYIAGTMAGKTNKNNKNKEKAKKS